MLETTPRCISRGIRNVCDDTEIEKVLAQPRHRLVSGHSGDCLLVHKRKGEKTYKDPQYTLTYAGRQRTYLVHTPPNYYGTTKLPLMLGFHGQGPGAVSFRLQSGFNNVADQHGFIMVYPNGTGPTNQLSWNSGPGAKNYASTNKIDDVGFVRTSSGFWPQTRRWTPTAFTPRG